MWKKRERGNIISFSLIFGKISRNPGGGLKIWGRRFLNWGWGRISSCKELFTSLHATQ